MTKITLIEARLAQATNECKLYRCSVSMVVDSAGIERDPVVNVRHSYRLSAGEAELIADFRWFISTDIRTGPSDGVETLLFEKYRAWVTRVHTRDAKKRQAEQASTGGTFTLAPGVEVPDRPSRLTGKQVMLRAATLAAGIPDARDRAALGKQTRVDPPSEPPASKTPSSITPLTPPFDPNDYEALRQYVNKFIGNTPMAELYAQEAMYGREGQSGLNPDYVTQTYEDMQVRVSRQREIRAMRPPQKSPYNGLAYTEEDFRRTGLRRLSVFDQLEMEDAD